MPPTNFLIMGEVYVDFFLDRHDGAQLRLGGVFHAIRAFDGIEKECYLAYYAPTYLEKDITFFCKELGVTDKLSLGVIDKCPNINLINNSKEAKPISYEMILRDQKEIVDISPKESFEEFVIQNRISDIIIYPGAYDLSIYMPVLEKHKIRIHIDFHYEGELLVPLITVPIRTAILSTSSDFFLKTCNSEREGVIRALHSNICEIVILKENRGGASLYDHATKAWYEAPAYVSTTEHSVGVGDCYNVIFLNEIGNENLENSLRIASYCTSLYAKTLNHEVFKNLCRIVYQNPDKYYELAGKRISWEERKGINIYIAAPDFENVDTSIIDELEKALTHHNFTPHRPIKENGLITKDTTVAEKHNIYFRDIGLINSCNGAIAVLLYNDPGTLVEIGMFTEKRKFVILFDPYGLAVNNFLLESVTSVCYSIDELIDKLYCIVGRNV